MEAKLGDFVAGIGAAAMAIREARVAAQERARRWEEQARLEAIEADKARRLKAFRVQFSEEAQAWQRHREAKAYLDHLRGQLPRDGLALPPEAQAWMEQAERAVERLDTGLRRLTGC